MATFHRASCPCAFLLPLQTGLGSQKLSKAASPKSDCIFFTEEENITNFTLEGLIKPFPLYSQKQESKICHKENKVNKVE